MKGFLSGPDGKQSHTRLLVVLCVPVLVMLPMGIWAFLCVQKGVFLAIDPTVPLYIGTANGIILGYAGVKGYQETQIAAQPGGTP